jgi:hypothetical protein
MHTQRQDRSAAMRGDGDSGGETAALELFAEAIGGRLPSEMTLNDAWSVHRSCVAAALSPEYSAAHNLVRVATLARTLDYVPSSLWSGAVPFTLRVAEVRIPPAEPSVIDPFYLINALQVMVQAEALPPEAPVACLLARMADAHRMILHQDVSGIHVEENAPAHVVALLAGWKKYADDYEPVLRQLLTTMLKDTHFPFGKEAGGAVDAITVIGFRYALCRLALMTETVCRQNLLTAEAQAGVISVLATLLDRHASAAFVLAMAEETGWRREARLRALVGDLTASAAIAA